MYIHTCVFHYKGIIVTFNKTITQALAELDTIFEGDESIFIKCDIQLDTKSPFFCIFIAKNLYVRYTYMHE